MGEDSSWDANDVAHGRDGVVCLVREEVDIVVSVADKDPVLESLWMFVSIRCFEVIVGRTQKGYEEGRRTPWTTETLMTLL